METTALLGLMNRLVIVVASLALILFFSATSAFASNLVINGDFETGDFTGWEKKGRYISVGTSSYTGSNHTANLGTVGTVLGSLAQGGLMTIPGMEYEFSFMLASSGGYPNEFRAIVNGVTLLNEVRGRGYSFTPYSFTFVADLLPTTIEFYARNDPGAFSLDNITVDLTPVPEPSTLLFLGLGLLVASSLGKKQRQSALAHG